MSSRGVVKSAQMTFEDLFGGQSKVEIYPDPSLHTTVRVYLNECQYCNDTDKHCRYCQGRNFERDS